MTCPECNEDKHHHPGCSELRWPDGRLRGADASGGLPALAPYSTARATEVAESLTATGESPLTRELGGIFAGVTEAMMQRHVAAQKAKP